MSSIIDIGGGSGGIAGSMSDNRVKRGERMLVGMSTACNSAMRKRVPEIGTAESTIRTALLAEDLVAYKNKRRIDVDDLTPEELSLLRYSMPEMCGAAISYVNELGVVPIAFEDGAFPRVPSSDLGRITVYVENGRKYYRWWKRRNPGRSGGGGVKRKRMENTDASDPTVDRLNLAGVIAVDADIDNDDGSSTLALNAFDPDPSVTVMSGFGYDPCADGTLVTPLASLVHAYAEKTFRDYLDAETARAMAKPVNWYARTDTLDAAKNSGASIDLNVPENMYVNTDLTSANTNDRIAQNEEELAQLHQHIEGFLRVEKEHNSTAASTIDGAGKKRRATRAKLTEDLLDALRRLLPLPIGATFASGAPQPHLSGEQKLRNDQFKEQVLTVLNVPLELINPMSTHRAGVEEVTSRFRSTTLRQWQRWLERILTFAYRMSLGRKIDESIAIVDNQLLKTCSEQCVTIGFVIEERASYEQLKELAYLRVLDVKHYREHVCRILHIDARDLADNPPDDADAEFHAKLDAMYMARGGNHAAKEVTASADK